MDTSGSMNHVESDTLDFADIRTTNGRDLHLIDAMIA